MTLSRFIQFLFWAFPHIQHDNCNIYFLKVFKWKPGKVESSSLSTLGEEADDQWGAAPPPGRNWRSPSSEATPCPFVHFAHLLPSLNCAEKNKHFHCLLLLSKVFKSILNCLCFKIWNLNPYTEQLRSWKSKWAREIKFKKTFIFWGETGPVSRTLETIPLWQGGTLTVTWHWSIRGC